MIEQNLNKKSIIQLKHIFIRNTNLLGKPDRILGFEIRNSLKLKSLSKQ